MKLLASCLEGTTRDQKVHIWTGSGANGKSTLIDLFESCLGDYCCKLPITLLTKKRNASNSASPEVQNAKGKRFASMQEPDEGDKINVGLMKELSGNDTIYSRGLYSSPVEFKPQFKMLLTCNQLPDIGANDDGTWRRVRVVEFGQKFVECPTNANEHKKDPDMYTKLKQSKDCFMFLLIEYLIDYRKKGLEEPQSVLKHTNMFKYKSDKMIQYFNENIEVTNEQTDKIPCLKFYHHFKSWFRDTNNTLAPNFKEFKEYIDNKLKYPKNSKGVYTCIRYIQNEEEDEEDVQF
jgi:P4 family phage/plasmid primase-like protien